MKHVTRAPLLALVALAVIGLSACAGTAAAKLQPGERTVYLTAIEPKGSTTVDKEPFPEASLPAGGGYGLKPPDDTGTWQVETYVWLPSEITVIEGDKVTLQVLGVNGSIHPARIEGYDVAFEAKRGQVTTVTFTADKAGVFKILCDVHQPTMTGTLIVLPAD
jgi:heme/copper-type cytochrome/quinol oxidase subunit 2